MILLLALLTSSWRVIFFWGSKSSASVKGGEMGLAPGIYKAKAAKNNRL